MRDRVEMEIEAEAEDDEDGESFLDEVDLAFRLMALRGGEGSKDEKRV
jgi:hypothetical protein